MTHPPELALRRPPPPALRLVSMLRDRLAALLATVAAAALPFVVVGVCNRLDRPLFISCVVLRLMRALLLLAAAAAVGNLFMLLDRTTIVAVDVFVWGDSFWLIAIVITTHNCVQLVG